MGHPNIAFITNKVWVGGCCFYERQIELQTLGFGKSTHQGESMQVKTPALWPRGCSPGEERQGRRK